MIPYTIEESDEARRTSVEQWLYGLDQVPPATRGHVITAWVTTWSSSKYGTLEEMPVAYGVDYPLMSHVNEVTRVGLDLAQRASIEWGMVFDYATLVPTLILHDVDKPFMYDRVGFEIRNSRLSREIPHGVLGGMLLKDLGFDHQVVSTISLHAGNAPLWRQSGCLGASLRGLLFSGPHAYENGPQANLPEVVLDRPYTSGIHLHLGHSLPGRNLRCVLPVTASSPSQPIRFGRSALSRGASR